MSKIVRHPDDAPLDDVPTTKIAESARRQVIAMVDGKRSPEDLPTTKITESARRQAIATAGGKRSSLEPSVVLRKRISVLDGGHLEDASDSASGPRPAPERTEAASEAPRPFEAPAPEPTESSQSVPAVSEAPRPSEAPAPEPFLGAARPSSSADVSLDFEDASDSASGLRRAPGRSASSRSVLAVFEAPRPSEVPMQPPAPAPALHLALGHASFDELGHTSPDVLLQAIPDHSGRRLAFIICFLALCSVGVLSIAAKSSPSSSHHQGVQARDHGVGR